jgi:hypothetical protein
VLLLGTTTIFAVNRLAVTLMVASRRRLVLCLLVTAPIWLVAVMWGHPEDCVALTLAIYALVRGFREQWRISGWLWGAAIAFQPFVLLMFPMALSVVPAGQRVKTIVRGALPALALLIIPLTTNWPLTSLALFKQPNYPTLDYPTPWMAVAPRLSALTVGSGPGRLIAVSVAPDLGCADLGMRRGPQRPVCLRVGDRPLLPRTSGDPLLGGRSDPSASVATGGHLRSRPGRTDRQLRPDR